MASTMSCVRPCLCMARLKRVFPILFVRTAIGFFPVYLNDWCKIQMRNKRKRAHSNNTTRQRTPNRFRETNHVNNIKLCSRNEYSSSFSFYLCSVGAVCNSFSHRMVFDCSVVCARWLEPLWTAYASVSLIYIRIRAAYGLVCNMQKLQC